MTHKDGTNHTQKKPKAQEGKGNEQKHPPKRPIKIKNVADAKKLLSRIIVQLQKGDIQNRTAKDLCYLLITYCRLDKSDDSFF